MTGWTLSRHAHDGLDDAMILMVEAFDPQFGEAWTASQCGAVLAMPGAALIIARDSRPLGFALLRSIAGETELMLLGVKPDARRQGIGLALLNESTTIARESGSNAYFLEVRSDNPALSFYHGAGLQQVGIRRDYYRGKDGKLRDALTLKQMLI